MGRLSNVVFTHSSQMVPHPEIVPAAVVERALQHSSSGKSGLRQLAEKRAICGCGPVRFRVVGKQELEPAPPFSFLFAQDYRPMLG
jgi:hypothetical protein